MIELHPELYGHAIRLLARCRYAEKKCMGALTMIVQLRVAALTLALLSSHAFAEDGKPTDPQIAHIAYTAGVIDVAAAKQALIKASKNEVKAFAKDRRPAPRYQSFALDWRHRR
jgi:hypothetical protein